MQNPTTISVKDFKAKLFIYYVGLPNCREKDYLEEIIKGVNKEHDKTLKDFLLLVSDKIRREKQKQTSSRNKYLIIWANIVKLISDYLSGVKQEKK